MERLLDAMLIPVLPHGEKYKNQIIDKMMRTQDHGSYHLSILDLTLNEEEMLPMNAGNFEEVYEKASILMLPSLLDYFQQTKKTSSLYILRVKFLNRWDTDDVYRPHGISWLRTDLREDNQVFNLFRKTFLQFFGSTEAYDRTSRGTMRANYLQGEQEVVITGVSFEAMANEKELRQRRGHGAKD
ncbi:MAG: hypothetical protein HC883_02990 [Bdellovibrionaceae bacterium]|nr:hypothetical protein [Pseudobdellovibrionaceae bacterium]